MPELCSNPLKPSGREGQAVAAGDVLPTGSPRADSHRVTAGAWGDAATGEPAAGGGRTQGHTGCAPPQPRERPLGSRQDTSPFVPAVWRGPAARSESGALAAGRGQPLRRRRRREGARPRLGGVGDLQSLRGPSHCPENIPLSPNTGAAFVKATFAPLEVKCNSPRKD